MNASTITLVLNILLAVFLLWGALWGLIRGFKNSLYRGLFLIIIMVIAFFISKVVTKAVINIDIGNWISLDVDGVKAKNLNEYLTLTIEKSVETTVDTTSAVSSLLTIVSIALNSIIFVLLFYILRLILSPVYSVLRRWVFDKKRYEKQEVKKGKKVKTKYVKLKTKRYRLAGAGVGVVLGLMMCMFTTVPVLGYLNIMTTVEKNSKQNNNSSVGVVSDVLGEDNYILVTDGYNNSIFSSVMKYSGMEFLSGLMFDSLSSTKVNKVDIRLNKEVETGLEVYNSINKMKMPDLNTCTQAELATFLTQCTTLTNNLFKSSILNSCIEQIMPIVVDYMIETDMIQDLTGAKRVFAINALNNLAKEHSEDIQSEILGLVGFAQTLNNYGLAIPILQNDTGNIIDFLQLTTNRTVVDDVTDKLFALNTVDQAAPDVANIIVEYICSALDIEETAPQVTSAQLKASIQNILRAMVDVLPDLDSKSDYIVTKNAIRGVGKVIDTIKDAAFMTDAMFDSTIDSVKDKLKDMTNGVPDWAQSIADEAIENISNITNFTNEFADIYSVVDDIDKACRDKNNNRSTNLDDIDFALIGSALNSVRDLTIAHRTNINEGDVDNLVTETVLKAIENYGDDIKLKDKELSSLESISQLKTNIKTESTLNWQTELPLLQDLIICVKNISNDSNDIITKLKDVQYKQEFVDLGKALDKAGTSRLFVTGAVDKKFMLDVMDIVDDDYQDDVDMLNAITSIKANINSAPNIVWENEFGNVVELINMDFDNVLSDEQGSAPSKAYSLGKTIDSVLANSNIITSEIIDTFICSVVDKNFSDTTYDQMISIVKDTFSDVDGNASNGYNNGIDCYAVEFEALNTLYQAKNIVGAADFSLTNDAQSLGEKIDEALATKIVEGSETYETKLVSPKLIDTFIRDVLEQKFDAYTDSTSKFSSAYNMIIEKFDDLDKNDDNGYQNGVQNYTVEMIALGKLLDVVDFVNGASFEFKTDGQQLGSRIDGAVSTTYTDGAGSVHNTQVVTTKLIDTYVTTLLDDYIPNDMIAIKENIKAKFCDIDKTDDVYQNAIDYYQVEFKALGYLITEVVDKNYDVSTSAGRVSIASALDAAVATYVTIGSTNHYTKVVVPSVINAYISDKVDEIGISSTDYNTLVTNIKNEIKTYLSDMESDSSKTYTICFADTNTLILEMDAIDNNDEDTNWSDDSKLQTIQNKLQAIQDTDVFSAKLARQMMLEILDKIKSYYSSDSYAAVSDKLNVIDAYKQYLEAKNSVSANDNVGEPYTATGDYQTEDIVLSVDSTTVTISKNRPLQYIKEYILASI